jgi:hypothetical protein
LCDRVRDWTPQRWSRRPDAAVDPGSPGPPEPRAVPADLVHALAQSLADLAADAEGRPRRVVPRLESDLALPDQLRVMVADLVAAGPAEEILSAATERVTTTAVALG